MINNEKAILLTANVIKKVIEIPLTKDELFEENKFQNSILVIDV